MNTNQIVKDGFSNPDTARLFESWDEERGTAVLLSNQNCGACQCCSFLVDSASEYEWLLCLNEDSAHYLETLNWAFACPDQIRDPTVEHLLLPEFDPPQFPSSYPENPFDPGPDDEP